MCKKIKKKFNFCQYDLCRSKYDGSEPFDYFEKGSKNEPNSKIQKIWKAYLTLEIVKQDKCPT